MLFFFSNFADEVRSYRYRDLLMWLTCSVAGLGFFFCVLLARSGGSTVTVTLFYRYQSGFFYVLLMRLGISGIVNTPTCLMCNVLQTGSRVTVNAVKV